SELINENLLKNAPVFERCHLAVFLEGYVEIKDEDIWIMGLFASGTIDLTVNMEEKVVNADGEPMPMEDIFFNAMELVIAKIQDPQ
ncbi:MAG: hypothetical protein HN365_04335, partial [Candidatus Pacebacteria bacterium]|nr:hypothetical protein [Candidatus Paceibacterota bacterium]